MTHLQAWLKEQRQGRWNSHPDMIKQYVACMAEKLKAYEELNITEPAIYLDVWRSMNKRFQQRMIDPNVDMVKAPWSPWQQPPWIKPLLTELSPWREKFTQIKKELREKSNFSDITFVADFPGLYLENFVSETLNASLTLLHGKLINITAITTIITFPANCHQNHPRVAPAIRKRSQSLVLMF